MDSAELHERFKLEAVPAEDLRTILTLLFGRLRFTEGRIEYLRNDEVVLAATYNRRGELEKLEPGPALTAEDVDGIAARIERDIFGETEFFVRREMAFAAVPVEAGWVSEDTFQMLVAPPDAPRPNSVMDYWPFVLEVAFRGPPDEAPNHGNMIAINRGNRELRRVRLLLAALVPWVHDLSPIHGNQDWAISIDGQPATGLRWTQSGYHLDGWEYRRKEFSPPPPDLLPTTEDELVFSRYTFSGGETLDLPESFDSLVEKFHALESERESRFLMWAYWLNYAEITDGYSRSASYMALVQAIEALTPQPSASAAPCPTCGKSQGPSLTEQFIAFLDAYAPRGPEEAERERVELYKLRSTLSHGGRLLLDEDREFGTGLYPRALEESARVRIARQLVRRAGVNWLAQDGD